MTEELKPLLEANYAIDDGDETLIGVSLGGLFAAWVLLTAPFWFDRYLLVSPALFWNSEEVWRWEEAQALKEKDLPASVFVSAGELETRTELRRYAVRIAESNPTVHRGLRDAIEWNDRHGWPRFSEITGEFADGLQSRKYPKLRIHCNNMPDETHQSVPPAAISRGLRYVFGFWQP